MSNLCITDAEILAIASRSRPAATPEVPFEPVPEGGYAQDPQKPVPVYGFFLNRTRPVPDLFAYLAERRLEMGDDAVRYIQQFDNLRVVAFTDDMGGQKLTRNLLKSNASFNGQQQYLVVGTRHMGVPGKEYDEVIGTLPIDKPGFYKSNHMTRHLRNLTANGNGTGTFEQPISRTGLLNLVRFAYNDSLRRMSPPRLDKQAGNRYTLAELMARYDKHYPTLFSKVYAITDTRGGRFAPEMVGRSVIFYAKYPKPHVTVDQLLQQGVSSEQLGYIPLNEGEGVTSTDHLLALLDETATDDPYAQGRLLLSDNVLKRLFQGMYTDSTLSTHLFKEFTDRYLNQELSATDTGRHYVQASRINRSLFLDQLQAIALNPELKEALDRTMQNKEIFPQGVFISPVIIQKENMKAQPIAEVYQSPENAHVLYERLLITGLADHAISAPSFDLDLAEEDHQRQQQFDALFTPEAPASVFGQAQPLSGVSVDGTVDVTPRTMAQASRHVREMSISELMAPFTADYNINAMDLSEFVRSEISPMLMTDNSANFTQRLQAYFDENTNC
jgi:hypothetical protein